MRETTASEMKTNNCNTRIQQTPDSSC